MATQTQDAIDGAPGLPQLDISSFGNQIFWLIISLLAIYLILSRIALPRIAEVLTERQDRITDDLAAAEELKVQASLAEEAYNQALVEARNEAKHIVVKAKAEMQVELDTAIKIADEEIAEKKKVSDKVISEIKADALESVRAVATDTASSVVVALGGSAEADKIMSAVANRMKG